MNKQPWYLRLNNWLLSRKLNKTKEQIAYYEAIVDHWAFKRDSRTNGIPSDICYTVGEYHDYIIKL